MFRAQPYLIRIEGCAGHANHVFKRASQLSEIKARRLRVIVIIAIMVGIFAFELLSDLVIEINGYFQRAILRPARPP